MDELLKKIHKRAGMFIEITRLMKKHPNDQDLGAAVRGLINKHNKK